MGGKQKKGNQSSRRVIYLSALLLAAIGVVGIFAAAYFGEKMAPAAGSLSSSFATALTTISISFIGIAIFTLALETKDWRDYFSERLREVVVENEYLNTLDPDTLKELQTNVLKAQFKNQAIDGQGSFLSYFHTNLHKFISSPYREDVSSEVMVKECAGRPDCFEVVDKVRFVCKASSGEIQTEINWEPDAGEFEDVLSLKVTAQCPQGHKDAGKKINLFPPEAGVVDSDLKNGARVPLDAHKQVDGLVVVVEAKYLVAKGKFQYWQMAHPTKNFDITITYPERYSIQFKTLVLEDVVSQITNAAGYLKFGYGSWALPQSGLAWLLTEVPTSKSPAAVVA